MTNMYVPVDLHPPNFDNIFIYLISINQPIEAAPFGRSNPSLKAGSNFRNAYSIAKLLGPEYAILGSLCVIT